MTKKNLPHRRRRVRINKFWDYVGKGESPDDCWTWSGATKKGYGRITVNYREWIAHRYSFFLTYGREPDGLLLHKCDNPPCCNPRHLWEGTDVDNMRDRFQKGRYAVGEKHCRSKLLDAEAKAIKIGLREGRSLLSLATEFNISCGVISDIKAGRTWRHI